MDVVSRTLEQDVPGCDEKGETAFLPESRWDFFESIVYFFQPILINYILTIREICIIVFFIRFFPFLNHANKQNPLI